MLHSRSFAVSLLSLGGILPCLLVATWLQDRRVICNIAVSSIISAAGFLVTAKLIPILKPIMLRASLFGMDINKKGANHSKFEMAQDPMWTL